MTRPNKPSSGANRRWITRPNRKIVPIKRESRFALVPARTIKKK